MSIIAIVPARGGSKGIKGKNIKLFCGKPLLYWTFNNIRNSNLFDLIYLSTDSKIIASYSKKIGFVIPQSLILSVDPLHLKTI